MSLDRSTASDLAPIPRTFLISFITSSIADSVISSSQHSSVALSLSSTPSLIASSLSMFVCTAVFCMVSCVSNVVTVPSFVFRKFVPKTHLDPSSHSYTLAF
eukprot:425016_1